MLNTDGLPIKLFNNASHCKPNADENVGQMF